MYLEGFICHWERGELGKVGKVDEWSEVARWERCLLFNYFDGSNEEILGGEAEIRGFMVKCGGKTVRGRWNVKFP